VFKTLDDVDVSGKTVLVRVDINSPVVDGQVQDNPRINAAAGTLKELSDKEAKVVVLAHQGRPGDKDFTNLEQHAELLTKHVGKTVMFIDDIYGEKAIHKIRTLKKGDILLLDNVRSLKEEMAKVTPEEHSKAEFVQTLAKEAELFVIDAFSAAHRGQASLVGFMFLLPTVVGREMQHELESLEKIKSEKAVLILGGAKPEDSLEIIRHFSEKQILQSVLTTGIVAQVFTAAKDIEMGEPEKFLKDNDYWNFVPKAKELLDKIEASENAGDIKIPIDMITESKKIVTIYDMPIKEKIYDIGPKTCDKYENIIKAAKFIVLNGTAGLVEEGFSEGTKRIFTAVAESDAFSLVGGGHSISAIEEFKIPKEKFSFISLAGGALISYLSGKKMPVLECLKTAKGSKT